jgi:antirestriction protein ArdC
LKRPKENIERIEHAERFFANTGAKIEYGGNRAYYAIEANYFRMPPFETFRDSEGHAATLAHELNCSALTAVVEGTQMGWLFK